MVTIDIIGNRARVFLSLDRSFNADLETAKAVGGGRYKDDPVLGKHHHYPLTRVDKLLKAFPGAWQGKGLAAYLESTKRARELKSASDAPQPLGVLVPLRRLQRVAVAFLSTLPRCILANPVGSGKTFIGIAWALEYSRAGLHNGVLVVTKSVGKYAYQSEILRAVPSARVAIIEGRDGWFPKPGSVDWVLINYELLSYRLDQIEASKFAAVIFSEAHKLRGAKSPRVKKDGTEVAGGTQRGGAALDMQGFIPNIMLETASLTPNRNSELFPLLQILGYVEEEDFYPWHVYFCDGHKIKVNRKGLMRWDFTGSAHSEELHQSIAPFTFAATKEEALPDLPEYSFVPIVVNISNADEYREAQRHFLQWLEEEKGAEAVAKAKKALAITKMGMLLQLAARGIVPAVVEELDSYADAKEKVVVFSSYKQPLADVEAKFPGMCVKITGDESSKQKDDSINAFQSDPSKLFCLCTTEAGGESATLTAAHTALFMSLPWSPKTFDQAWGRCVTVDSMITTMRGPIKAEDVKQGDFVLTHKGRYRKVLGVFRRNHSGGMVKISFQRSHEELKLTYGHPILVMRKDQEPKWIPSESVTVDDWLLFPRPSYERKIPEPLVLRDFIDVSITTNDKYGSSYRKPKNFQMLEWLTTPKTLDLTDEGFLFMAGWYLAEGCVSKHEPNRPFNMVKWAFNGLSDSEMELRDKIAKDAKRIFGVNARPINKKKKSGRELAIHSSVLAPLFLKMFGKGCFLKSIPEWMMRLPLEKLRIVFDAYIRGDGHTFNEGKSVSAGTSSPILARQIREIGLALGYNPCLRVNLPAANNNYTAPHYIVAYTITPSENPKSHSRVLENTGSFMANHVISISHERVRREKVVNFMVDEDESYVADDAIVHNCHRIGQKNPVQIIVMIARQTAMVDVVETLYAKNPEINRVITGEDRSSTSKVLRDILGLVASSPSILQPGLFGG